MRCARVEVVTDHHLDPGLFGLHYISTATLLFVITLALILLPRIFVYLTARCSKFLDGHPARPEGGAFDVYAIATQITLQPLLHVLLFRDSL